MGLANALILVTIMKMYFRAFCMVQEYLKKCSVSILSLASLASLTSLTSLASLASVKLVEASLESLANV
jgi:hypothetical protein